jgi:hypothetical protein
MCKAANRAFHSSSSGSVFLGAIYSLVCELYCDCRIDTVDEKRRAPMQDEYRDGCTENE